MALEYMQNLKDNLNLPNSVAPTEGLSISKIESLELKHNNGKLFPKAFREYLSLAGEFNNIGFDDNGIGLDALQDLAKKNLKYNKRTIPRPFFAFDSLYACEQFYFFYLDENKDDPDIYSCYPYYEADGVPLVERAKDFTFSGLVNKYIWLKQRNLPF